jgi:hypothetical protein
LHINKKRGWETAWTNEEDRILIENYPSYGSYKVVNLLLHRSRFAVQERAKKLGVKYLQYDKDYFENIDSPEKAYWLGFLYTDGYVSTGGRWGVELSIVDTNHLQKLLDAFKCNMLIRTRERQTGASCSILIKNAKMYDDLVRNGVVPNKTAILKFPKLVEDLMPHFIRGLFDGDGSYAPKEISFVCRSETFVQGLCSFIESRLGIIPNISLIKRDNLLPVVRIWRKNDRKILVDYLYKDATTFLERKRTKAHSN